MVELVQMEVQELDNNDFDADDDLFVAGSALLATEGNDSDISKGAIRRLMDVVDANIDEPERDTAKPFLMPVEDVFTITGRGTVATGRIERGIIHVGDSIEIVGLRETTTSTCTGVEMFRKSWTKVKLVTMLDCCFVA